MGREWNCLPRMQCCAARACALDADGTTKIGAASSLVFDSVVTIGMTPVYEDGTEIKEKDACGRTFVDVVSDPTLTRWDIDIDVWSQDPSYLKIVQAGGSILLPGGGLAPQGFAYPDIGPVVGQFSFEFWQKIIRDNDQDPDLPWEWFALPKLKNVKLGKIDVGGDKVSHRTLTAQAYGNANWFNGPGDDWPTTSDRPVQSIPTATLPTASCAPTAISS